MSFYFFFFFSSRRRHTRCSRDWSSDVCSSDLGVSEPGVPERWQDPFTILGILTSAKTVAIVGLSPNELRASHFVGFYLRRHGYRIVPVNPREKSILGETSYASLSEIPVPIAVVD